MGGGTPSHSDVAVEDDSSYGFAGGVCDGNETPWPPLFTGVGVNNANVGSFPGDSSHQRLEGPPLRLVTSWGSMQRPKETRGYMDYAFESRDLQDVFQRYAGENCAIFEIQTPRHFSAAIAEETVQMIQRIEESATDLQMSFLAPTTTLSQQCTGGSLQPVREKIFKLMQIENNNLQDLYFIEKVILSPDEIVSLCNNITAGSASVSDASGIVDFGSLNSNSMKVAGFFGSKDVMSDIFQNTKLTEQVDVWTQIHNDTLAPGLYAWLDCKSLLVFYWHQGHLLPEATRKDMSCNFIRYIFDLCDTFFVCLEGRNLRNSLFEIAPKFLKHHRTRRLQFFLVKALEDSVKVTAGLLLKSLALVPGGNAPTASGRSQKPSGQAFGFDYKLSEGHNRVDLLASSNRPRNCPVLERRRR